MKPIGVVLRFKALKYQIKLVPESHHEQPE